MNAITISGFIKGEAVKGVRELEFRLVDSSKNGIIKCMYWTKSTENIFTKLAPKSHIFIKGHFDYEDELGLYLIVEEFERVKPYENLAVH